jgi:DNA polymerase III delta prime subunit
MSIPTPIDLDNIVESTEESKLSIVEILVKSIKTMKDSNFELLKIIKDPDLLIIALNDLDSLIEMHDIKTSIVNQIHMMLVLAYSRMDQKEEHLRFDGHMLHGVICGPPGVGKSSVAKCIAKIFYALGVIKDTPKDKSEQNLTKTQDIVLPRSPPDAVDHQTLDSIAHECGEALGSINELRQSVVKLVSTMKLIGVDQYDEILSDISKHSISTAFKYGDILTLCQPFETEDFINIPDGAATISLKPPTLPDPYVFKHNELPKITEEDTDEPLHPPIIVPSSIIEPIEERIKKSNESIVICGRTEFVGEYSGHTTKKTHEFLTKNKGKVIVIEEAYLLYSGEKDTFGMEALTELNRFMDEHPTDVIIYMTGYKKLLQETIFAVQPGLKRRCEQIFTIKGYTASGLGKIYKKQMSKDGWSLSEDVDIDEFFISNEESFPNYGGDTLKLTYKCKQSYATNMYKGISDGIKDHMETGEDLPEKPDLVINKECMDEALISLNRSTFIKPPPSPPPPSMFM